MSAPVSRRAARTNPPPQTNTLASTPASANPVMQKASRSDGSTFERVLTVPVVGTLIGGVVQAKLALFDDKGDAPGEKPGVAATLLKGAAFPFVTVGYWIAGAVGRLTRS